MFDLAVNGGGQLTVNYQKTGFISAQRHIEVPWQDFAPAPDVVLIPQDEKVTTINLASSEPIQVASGRPVTDIDGGTRQATLLFPQGTKAEMVMPDRNRPLTTLNVRVTEFTVGANGPQAMPAELPPQSGYTYAFDLSADEARAAGALRVDFAQPIPVYVENFLNFPVGTEVPLGSYDSAQGGWVPSDSGRVIEILGITNDAADLDTTGKGAADNGALLKISDAERKQLASLYCNNTLPCKKTLWRMPIPHFSPWDANCGFGPPSDATPPSGPDATADDGIDNSCEIPPIPGARGGPGSTIECQNQVLGETISVTGTPFNLNYSSNRVLGRKSANSITIPLSGTSLPSHLKQIELEISVAGRLRTFDPFSNAANQTTPFTWDHKDAYGRLVQGAQLATVRIGYTYDGGAYQQTSRFGYDGNGIPITGIRTLQQVTLWKTQHLYVGAPDFRTLGLGAWSLNVHHMYDVNHKVLYLGDRRQRSADALGATIATVPSSRGIDIYSLVAGTDGSVYFGESSGI